LALVLHSVARWGRPLLGAAALLLVASCASLRAPTLRGVLPSASEAPRVWTLDGRIGVKVDSKGWSASLRWSQNREDFSAHFSGPFGRGAVEVRQRDGKLWVRDPEGREHRGADLQQWAHQQFGAELPIGELSYWLVGIAEPGRPAGVVRGEGGRPLRLEQGGWQVRFLDWTDLGRWLVPRRLVLSRADVEVKVVVDHWAEENDSRGPD
jgi:outer membrane lipoprotein LolB